MPSQGNARWSATPVTDVQGARLARVHSIGYANKPGKRERLSEAGAGRHHQQPRRPGSQNSAARVADPEL